MTQINSVIFDLDGTLIDSEPGVKDSFAQAVATIFPGAEFDVASVVIGPPLPKMFEAVFPQASSEDIKALVHAFREHYCDIGWKKTRLFEDVKATLATLHSSGRALYVVTNKPINQSRKILGFFELDQYFQEVRSLDSVSPPYRNKMEMVRLLVQDRHLKAEQCVLIGDTIGDADAAHAIQIPFIWVSFGYGKCTDLPSSAKTANSYKELAALLS